ncbi:MAG: type II toxin-antitoxin system RelE/ParE family toxin [Proteobacteria bacterium]|nr:type II toxin-antitoxin system RelE/ParE family toxin [Pseudomonadota bacterium]
MFKNKWFYRWARGGGVSDSVLLAAAAEIAAGKVEANLGGYLFKKRLPRPGSGKSGGYRTIVGYRKPNSERIIFLYAFSKNAKSNISDKEESALSLAAEAFVSATDTQVSKLLAEGSIWEVQYE